MDSNLLPRISIIVAIYNRCDTLQECIKSICDQTYKNIEIILIDGGSTDGTIEIIRQHSNGIKFWCSEPDSGICSAWNKGLAHVTGDWVYFMGADDYLWEPTMIERLSLRLLELPSEIRVAYGRVMLLTPTGNPLYAIGENWKVTKARLKYSMSIPHQGTMHRYSLFEQHGTFDETLSVVGDYELLMRHLRFENAAFIPDIIVAGMRIGGTSGKKSNWMRTLFEMRVVQKRYVSFFPHPLWVLSFLKTFIRLCFFFLLGDKNARILLDARLKAIGRPEVWTK
jgi:glycosyltransferase involved in cell wall biosynthesis